MSVESESGEIPSFDAFFDAPKDPSILKLEKPEEQGEGKKWLFRLWDFSNKKNIPLDVDIRFWQDPKIEVEISGDCKKAFLRETGAYYSFVIYRMDLAFTLMRAE